MSTTTKSAKIVTTLLSSGDVLRLLNVSREGVYFLMRRGQLHPVARTANGMALFDPTEVERVRLDRERRGVMRSRSVVV